MQTSCGCLKNGAIRVTVSWFCITDMNRWTLQVLVTINSWLSIHKSFAFIGRARSVLPILNEMSFLCHPCNHLNVNFFSSYTCRVTQISFAVRTFVHLHNSPFHNFNCATSKIEKKIRYLFVEFSLFFFVYWKLVVISFSFKPIQCVYHRCAAYQFLRRIN